VNTFSSFSSFFYYLLFWYIVGSAEQLSLAIEHQVEASSQQNEQFAQFACAAYEDGSEACAWARSNAGGDADLWISPVFVSAEEDLLCFIVRSTAKLELPGEIFSNVSFLVPLPAQLKLEPNILELIDALSILQDPASSSSATLSSLFSSPTPIGDEDAPPDPEIDLIISYYSNATTIHAAAAADSPDYAVESNDDRSAGSLSNLLAYSTTSLRSFYWSESSAAGQSFNNSVSENVDLWDDFLEILDTQSVSTTEDGSSDACGFKELGVFSVDGDIVVPLTSLLSSCDARQAGACLAFLVSEYASDPLVSHLSLASRPVLLNYRARSIQQVRTLSYCLD
jgi:hypothetical protein